MTIDLGMETAALLALQQADEPERWVQPALLPADEVPEDLGELRQALRGPKRRGRPAGAKNRKTEAWTGYILARYTSPLVFLAEVIGRPVEALAAQLQCSPLEAFQLQLRAADILAPYLHGKQPVAVNMSVDLPTLVLIEEAAGQVVESEDFQWISDAAGMPVGRVQSDASAETEAPCGFHAPEPLIEDQSSPCPGQPLGEADAGPAGRSPDPAGPGGTPPNAAPPASPPVAEIASGISGEPAPNVEPAGSGRGTGNGPGDGTGDGTEDGRGCQE